MKPNKRSKHNRKKRQSQDGRLAKMPAHKRIIELACGRQLAPWNSPEALVRDAYEVFCRLKNPELRRKDCEAFTVGHGNEKQTVSCWQAYSEMFDGTREALATMLWQAILEWRPEAFEQVAHLMREVEKSGTWSPMLPAGQRDKARAMMLLEAQRGPVNLSAIAQATGRDVRALRRIAHRLAVPTIAPGRPKK